MFILLIKLFFLFSFFYRKSSFLGWTTLPPAGGILNLSVTLVSVVHFDLFFILFLSFGTKRQELKNKIQRQHYTTL